MDEHDTDLGNDISTTRVKYILIFRLYRLVSLEGLLAEFATVASCTVGLRYVACDHRVHLFTRDFAHLAHE